MASAFTVERMPATESPGTRATIADELSTGWADGSARAELHYVSGKGGTGKTTVATALALALASTGKRVLLVEVEERQGIARIFDRAPLPYREELVARVDGGGKVFALAIDVEAAMLDYLDTFYHLGVVGKVMKSVGAIEFATTIAPGLKDVLLTGKVYEVVTREHARKEVVYDAVVVDAPPTGRIGKFLDVTKAVSELAKGGPVHGQAESVVRLLHSEETAVHLVTLLEALPLQETVEAIGELRSMDLPVGSVIVNRNIPSFLPSEVLERAADGDVDADTIRAELVKVGIHLDDDEFAGLLTEVIEHASLIRARSESAAQLDAIDVPRLALPAINDGIDLGSLYELAECLAEQGVR